MLKMVIVLVGCVAVLRDEGGSNKTNNGKGNGEKNGRLRHRQITQNKYVLRSSLISLRIGIYVSHAVICVAS
jgi:hypothetical protein